MVKRVVAVVCALGFMSGLAACGEEENKQFIGWPCDLLTEDEVEEAVGVPVAEDTIAGDEVRAEGNAVEGVVICRWNGTAGTGEAMVEIHTARTLDLFAAYAGSVDGRDEPYERSSSSPGDAGETVVLANKGRSLAIQCRQLAAGGRWEPGTCAELGEKAMGRVKDDDLDPEGKVPATDVCDLLTEGEVRELTGVGTAASAGSEEDTPLGGKGIQSFECQWVESGTPEFTADRDLVTVWAQLRLADQCRDAVGGAGMFDQGGDSYRKVTGDEVRLGAAKGEYCLHLRAYTGTIARYGGTLTEDEATKLFDGAVERLDAR